MMLSPGLSLLLSLCQVPLFPSTLDPSSCPAWATVTWDVSPQDWQQQGTGTWSHCSNQPCPAKQLQSFAQLARTLGTLDVVCLRCSAQNLLIMEFCLHVAFAEKPRDI